jgi:GAF domain-containing protein
MSFFRGLLPTVSLPGMEKRGELAVIRERILQGLWLFVLATAIILFALSIPVSLRQGDIVTTAIYISMMVYVAIISLIRRLPYTFRVYTLLFVPFFFGVRFLTTSGVEGNGRLFIILFLVLAVALLEFRQSLVALGIALVSIAAVATGILSGNIPIPLPGDAPATDSVLGWAYVGVFSLIIFGATALAVYITENNLNTSLKTQQGLYTQVERERATLEERVESRTQDVERRSLQLRTAAEISRSISTLLDPQEVIQTVADLVRDRFNLYYAGVFLLDESGEYAVLRAGTGEAGEKMIERGHRLAVGGSSMIGWATATRQSRIALDVGLEATRFNNPLLPFTRSELAIPIISRDAVLGALSIQSTQSEAFDNDDIVVMQSVADSLAVALQNARLYQETQQTLQEIQSLNRAYIQEAWTEARSQHARLAYTYEDQTAPAVGLRTVEIPLLLRDQPLGTISLELASPEFTEEEQAFLDSVATQTAQALENARLLEETQRRAVQERKLNELSALFTQALSIDEILRTAVVELGKLPSVAEVAIALTAPEEVIELPVADEQGKEQA